jgi:hypothetical protein
VLVKAALLQEIAPFGGVSLSIRDSVRGRITRKEGNHMVIDDFPQPRHEGSRRSIAGDTSRVSDELLSPDETRLLAEIDDVRKEAAEDGDSESLADAREAGGIG